MTDMAAFLLARIAEDEAVARAAAEHWHEDSVDAVHSSEEVHAYRFDPARVLAECEAKRRIVALDICTACAVEAQPCNHQDETLRLLALGYADHPDYDEEWRP